MDARLPFWSMAANELLRQLGTTADGLTSEAARERLARHGANLLRPKRRLDSLALLRAQFESPIVLLLAFAAVLSFFLHDPTDALIILAIVLASGGLGFWQERGAADAVEKLLAVVRTRATALRDGEPRQIPLEEIVPGDVVVLAAGASIPGDCSILASKDLFVDEAVVGREHARHLLHRIGLAGERVFRLAYLNAFFETGFLNPIDQAIRAARSVDVSAYEKLDEVPYDFVRKRLSILVMNEGRALMVTKGALANVLGVCSAAEVDGAIEDLASVRDDVERRFSTLGAQGLRTLGVAYRELGGQRVISKGDETRMAFAGFVVVADPPKADASATVAELGELGVALKVITGDSHLVAASVAQQLHFTGLEVLTGRELREMSDEALRRRVSAVDVFAEVEPNQKERIILALKAAGHVVGYMGDGINDASALHAADVGISVDSAVDVAKEAADIVLLEKDLGVLVQGVRAGRTTFANTLKYVFMATSANFGNMFSMAGVSLFLPFLPLLPKQILLTNLLTDLPEMTIAGDVVDAEMVMQPRRWDIVFIRRFMIVFGLLSTVFDFATFGALLLVFRASEDQFRTGWFAESVVSAALVVLVIRTRRPFFRSMPGPWLLAATLLVAAITVALPFSPLAGLFDFVALPARFVTAVGVIVALYVAAAEQVKHVFYRLVSD